MPDPAVDPAALIAEVKDARDRLSVEIGKVVVGQKDVVELVLLALFTRGHALLVGVPGLAKTLLVSTIAQALDLKFSRIQFTPDLMPGDITGTEVIEEDKATGGRSMRFVKGPVFANLLLADEINRTPPKTQAALLEAMQERHVTAAGVKHELPNPFFVLATQNPIEQEGTYPLPEAQLDRFMLKLDVGYSSREELGEILNRTTMGVTPDVQPVLDAEKIVGYQQLVRQVMIAPHVQDYAVRAVLATHPDGPFATSLAKQFLRFGGSPRAAQALVLGAKVRALLDGRAHVAVDDITQIMPPVLRHRVGLNFEGTAEGITPDMVVNDIVDHLPVEAAVKAGV